MTTINSKMGLKPRTRARTATHSGGIVSDATCPKCPGRHVVEYPDRDGRLRRRCGFCGHQWFPDEEAMHG